MTRTVALAPTCLMLCLLLAASLAGCGAANEPPQATTMTQNLSPLVAKDDKVVAQVNGTPILASDLEAQLESGGKASPKEALEQLIQLELLAQEAKRRGLTSDKAALKVRRQAMARQMLEVGFNRSFGPDAVPRDMVEKAYKRYQRRYNHAELVKVTHVLILASEKEAAAKHKAARRAANAMHAAVAGKGLNDADFVARAKEAAAKFPDLRFHTESLSTDLRGRTDINFSTAAFALKKEGDVSGVAKTRYGYHVIRMIKRTPARKDSLQKVAQEVRRGIADGAKQAVFSRWIEDLSKTYKIEVNMHVLSSALGTPAPAGSPAK
jgi:peptidyl-prolyl cis-trans isomerase C